jgi:hypothetical protein
MSRVTCDKRSTVIASAPIVTPHRQPLHIIAPEQPPLQVFDGARCFGGFVCSGCHPTNRQPTPFGLHAMDLRLYPHAVDAVECCRRVEGSFGGFSKSVVRFAGIRFAEAPTAELRWAAPKPWLPANGATIKATEFAPNCMQSTDGGPAWKTLNLVSAAAQNGLIASSLALLGL